MRRVSAFYKVPAGDISSSKSIFMVGMKQVSDMDAMFTFDEVLTRDRSANDAFRA